MKHYQKVAKITLCATALLAALGGCSQRQAPSPSVQWEALPDSTDKATVVEHGDNPAAPQQPAIEQYNSVLEARDIIIHRIDEGPELLPDATEMTVASIVHSPSQITDSETDFSLRQKIVGARTEPIVTDNTDNAPPPPSDIWSRIRAGFALPDGEHPKVVAHTRWYAKHQRYLDRTFNRGKPYLYYIVDEVEKRGMPLEIALLPVVESAFQPFAYSHGRASGIWQFIPGTARNYGLKIDWWYDGRRDIQASTQAALNYLERLNKLFDGDWLLALAAYNSGEGTVLRAVRKNKKRGKKTTFWDLKLPKETRSYVPKLLAISNIVARPEAYQVSLIDIANEPYLIPVETGSQIDLALAADLAGIELEELYVLNPGFNRWATSPDGPHRLLLPLDKAESFKQKLAQLPPEKRVKWVRHRIGEGETLGHIAKKYHTTVGVLQRINNIRGHMIRAGKHLLIPVASQSATVYALSAEQRLQARQNAPRKGTRIDYTVRPGDTLWDISRAYNVSVRALASWNNMAPRDTLRPQQKLVIWAQPKQTGIAAALPAPSSPGLKATTRKINYRVRQGDSLARISQRFNVSVTKLKQWNPSARGKYIQPGQNLIVYVDVTRVSENI